MENELVPVKNGKHSENYIGPLSMDNLYEYTDFKNIFILQRTRADGILDIVSDIVNSGVWANQLKNSQSSTSRYVVKMSDSLKDAIDKGFVKLDTSNNGEIFAQIRDQFGHFGPKLSITKEIVKHGIDPVSVSQALQIKAIEKKLESMVDMLDEIGRDVISVIQGQQNDRIGLYNSGLTLYLESRSIQDPTFRGLVAAQALKTLSDGNEQILQQLRMDIQYLMEGKYREKKGHSAEDMQAKMASINRSFDIIHRSYLLKAVVFYERGEIPATLAAIDEYGRFLQKEIMPYAPRLTEFDKSDVLLHNGRWETRAKLFEDIGRMKKQLAENHTYCLGVEATANG